MEASDKIICPSCKQECPTAGPLQGLCPTCLLNAGLHSGTHSPGEQARPGDSSPPSVDELQPLFPQLELLELIGWGGMGAVYKARQPKLNRFIALKVLTQKPHTDGRFAERFQQEAQALARMGHPNIVTVYDFGEAGGHYFLLMEYIDGLNLRQLEQSRRLAPAEALAIVPPICDALQYAHSCGVVHRDIKPENILLDKAGRVKIADFGIAKILSAEPGIPLTGAGQRVGTPHYMAPEQIERPADVDHRADIYSLGVVFYEMLTGELPLGRFANPSQKVQIDVRLDEVVLKALEKEPELRFQQASEIRSRVETLTTTPGPVTPTLASPPAEEPAAEAITDDYAAAYKRQKLTGLALGGITMIIFLGIGSWFTQRPQSILWWNIGFGIALISLTLEFFRIQKTPATELLRKRTSLVTPNTSFNSVSQDNAKDLIRPVAFSLMLGGLFTLGVTAQNAIGFAVFFRSYGQSIRSINSMALLLFGIPWVIKVAAAAVVIAGGWQAIKLQSYSLSVMAALLAIIVVPYYVGIPIGIWALVVLNKAEVRKAMSAGSDQMNRLR